MTISIKLDCGIHYGFKPGQCHKCKYLNSDYYSSLVYRGLQHQGDSWQSILQPSFTEPVEHVDFDEEIRLGNEGAMAKAAAWAKSDPVMANAILMEAFKNERRRLARKLVLP